MYYVSYRVSKIKNMDANALQNNRYYISQKKNFFADRKINLFKNCSKISHVTVTFVGVDFFVRTFFAADKFITKVANLNIPGLI